MISAIWDACKPRLGLLFSDCHTSFGTLSFGQISLYELQVRQCAILSGLCQVRVVFLFYHKFFLLIFYFEACSSIMIEDTNMTKAPYHEQLSDIY